MLKAVSNPVYIKWYTLYRTY